MRTIRASEIGVFLYCRRAWWYQSQGLESQNRAGLAAGTSLHRRHSRGVFLAGAARTLALLLLLAALALLTAYLVRQAL